MIKKNLYYSGLICVIILLLFMTGRSQNIAPLNCGPLMERADLSAKMVEGINHFLIAETGREKSVRNSLWKRDFGSTAAFHQSIAGQRALLAARLGVADERIAPDLQLISNSELKPFIVETARYTIYAVRWNAVDGITAEGLLIKPKIKLTSGVVMIPDADIVPEVLAGLQQPQSFCFGAALQLALAGTEVLIPTLVSRDYNFSGNPALNIFTKLPHREWIYRQSYEVGRHVIGYELQKVFAAIDWLESGLKSESGPLPIGVAGYGEGGLLALYATALDDRISSTLVSGYFDVREKLWQEPIYRNVFGLLTNFGDAELATMSWPRSLIIEQSKGPEIVQTNPGSAPGIIKTPTLATAKAEFDRAKALMPAPANQFQFLQAEQGLILTPFSHSTLKTFMHSLHIEILSTDNFSNPVRPAEWVDENKRQERTVKEMGVEVQHVLTICERTRNRNFWNKLEDLDVAAQKPFKDSARENFWHVLGKLPIPSDPINAKSRLLEENVLWTSYEITLDVFNPDVFAWGILIIPKDIKPGERRPVVVCQHGLEGTPFDTVTTDSTAENYHYYKGFATRLAERGYITFSPHNPYRGGDKFRVIQRMANPLGLTLFSVIIAQHQRIVEWLQRQSFVDPARIGFYGLSYGGKTAMRVPAIVQGYALSICSGDFNEWVRKVSGTEYDFSYVYNDEYDMPEWDLGHTFNYAEMAALIAPRPFMVERGYYDGVATDEWVNYEFAKVKRHYGILGLDSLVHMESFPGPHTINGQETFKFLDHHLKHE
jgi:dienelactone hydrolase